MGHIAPIAASWGLSLWEDAWQEARQQMSSGPLQTAGYWKRGRPLPGSFSTGRKGRYPYYFCPQRPEYARLFRENCC